MTLRADSIDDDEADGGSLLDDDSSVEVSSLAVARSNRYRLCSESMRAEGGSRRVDLNDDAFEEISKDIESNVIAEEAEEECPVNTETSETISLEEKR